MLWIEISKRIFEEEDEEDRAVVAVGEVTVVAAAAEVTVVAAVEVTRLLHKIKEVTPLLIAGLILLRRFPLIQVQAVATKAQSVRDGLVLVNGLDLDPLRPHVKKKLGHPNQCLLDDFHRTKKEINYRKNASLIKVHLKEEICLFKSPCQGLDLDHPSAN